jgi:O-antigen ligase
MTSALPVLITLAGPGLRPLLLLFGTTSILTTETTIFAMDLQRFVGLTFMSQAVCWLMMLRFGIRGILDLHRPWRFITFALVAALGLLGGFRSFLLLFAIISLVQFYFEGLFRTRVFVLFSLAGVVCATLLFAFADKLPGAVQRSISFLPVQIDPAIRRDATGTLDWRLEMWREALPIVPKYLLLGKGYNFDGTDYYLTMMGAERGIARSYDASMISSDYHQGILTLIIPFGIWGLLAFLAFCVASLRVLYRNYRYGSPELRLINMFLLSYFTGRLLFYLILYGQFDLDLMVFTGLIGLSLSLNGGMRQAAAVNLPAAMESTEDWRLQPGLQPYSRPGISAG